MKNHVLRPLWLAIAFVAIVLLARYIIVPKDFGVQGDSFTFNYHRASNVQEWKDFPVSYLGKEVCVECHEDQGAAQDASAHSIIQCENCHGPGKDHPETEDPATMLIDRSRLLCLRCHADLQYANTSRADIPGIDPNEHNTESQCVECHDPHTADFN